MRVTAQTKEATEKTIRACARKLFVRKGLDGTSTRQIASAARIAVGTLFNYFPSKEALAMAIASEAFDAGRAGALDRLDHTSDGPHRSVEEDLFTLVAADIRALEPLRSFMRDVLEAGLSPFAGDATTEASAIRTARLEDAAGVLARHGLDDAATAPVMHLYWSLYVGVLSFWAADSSPKQEDTWALLDRGMRMFAGALRPAPAERPAPSLPSILGADPDGAAEVAP